MNIHNKEYHFDDIQSLKIHLNYQSKDYLEYNNKLESLLKLPFTDIPRVSEQEFVQFDKPSIIYNLDKDWLGWSFNELENIYYNEYFRIGIDDDGNYLNIKFGKYIEYLKCNQDHSPLYLFDGNIPQNMLKQYQVPNLFKIDYLSYLGDKRPQFRWILVGPKRSGSQLHVDPYETGAWNTVLKGRKLWLMFPPDTDEKLIYEKKQEIDNVIDYFILLKIETNNYVLFIQNEHETVYIPNGWHHAVVNLEDTIAVTQNFVNDHNFEKFWIAFYKESPGKAKEFYKQVKQENKQLFDRIEQLNNQNGINLQIYEYENEDILSQDDELEQFHNIID